jgi:hypothetical protein
MAACRGSVGRGVGSSRAGRRSGLVARRPSAHAQQDSCHHADHSQRPWEAVPAPGVAEQCQHCQRADDDEDHGATALIEPHDGGPGVLPGHQQPAGAVDDQPRAAEEDEHDKGDAQDDRVDVEVSGESAGHARDVAVGARPAEAAEITDLLAGGSWPRVDPGRGGCLGWWRRRGCGHSRACAVHGRATIGDGPEIRPTIGMGGQGSTGVEPHGWPPWFV